MRSIVRFAALALLLCAAAGCPNRGKGPDLSALEDLKRPKDTLPPPRELPDEPRPKGTLPPPRELPGEAQDVFFCFWNVENLFDDVDDGRGKKGDETYDPYFAKNAEIRETKYAHVAQVLAKMNGGKGPDIIALAEVESRRATELLRDAINSRLPDPKLHYTTIVFEEAGGGRDIATPVMTRLPIGNKRGRLLGNKLRIMESRIVVNGHELVVVASHWSSRLSDKTGATRAKYADQIQGRYRAILKGDPKVDFLVCGDFNDDPDEPSVIDHLKAVKDIDAVKKGDAPLLLNATARTAKDGEGTHYYRKFHLFDHICVSPGLLDGDGWTALPDTAAIVPEMADKAGRPNRFGGPSDKRAYSRRGASDHFPVTIRLRVAASKQGVTPP